MQPEDYQRIGKINLKYVISKLHREEPWLKIKFVLFATLLFIISIIPTACARNTSTKLRIVTSTSLIECIVREVGGSHVEVTDLVPPNQHPGNFDIKPGDIEKLANAKLLLLHGYPGESWSDRLITSADNPNLVVEKVGVEGNWMIPSVQITATEKIAGILSEIDPENASTYTMSAENYIEIILNKQIEINDELIKADVPDVNVIASVRQADFLEWAGFDVISTYGGTTSLTPQLIQDLVDLGKAENVALIVNNIQDGKDAGKAIAEEIGAENLNLSNFPGGLDDTGTWEKAIDRNITILLDAVARFRAGII